MGNKNFFHVDILEISVALLPGPESYSAQKSDSEFGSHCVLAEIFIIIRAFKQYNYRNLLIR